MQPGSSGQRYPLEVAHYLFNSGKGDPAAGPRVRELAVASMGVGLWAIDPDEPHLRALAPGDLILIYLGAPDQVFIGSAELASAVHVWTSSEARAYPGESPSGVSLAHLEEWEPPVPMSTVLSRIGPSEKVKADFQAGVVRITVQEYETASAVAAGL